MTNHENIAAGANEIETSLKAGDGHIQEVGDRLRKDMQKMSPDDYKELLQKIVELNKSQPNSGNLPQLEIVDNKLKINGKTQ